MDWEWRLLVLLLAIAPPAIAVSRWLTGQPVGLQLLTSCPLSLVLLFVVYVDITSPDGESGPGSGFKLR